MSSINFAVGSKVAVFRLGEIHPDSIVRETKCYWVLRNDVKLKKGENHYYDIRGRRREVNLWDDAIEKRYQDQQIEKAAKEKIQHLKSSISSYCNYVQIGNCQRLDDTQIIKLEAAFKEIFGDLKTKN